jgi:hypothetical protein
MELFEVYLSYITFAIFILTFSLLPVLFLLLLWKKKRTPALVIILIFLLSCTFICVYWEGYYLPFKACRPIIYPEGQRITEEISYTTPDPSKTVLPFFDQRLKAKSVEDLGWEDGQWMKTKVDSSMTLYWCVGADINLSTGETGCIYVRPEGNGTRIRTEFLRWEGASWLCSALYK